MEEIFSNGDKYFMRVEVGFLIRNIRIIGVEYLEMFIDFYGVRVFVGVIVDVIRRYIGMYWFL